MADKIEYREVSPDDFAAFLRIDPASRVRDVAQQFEPPMERFHTIDGRRLVAYRVLYEDEPAKCYVEARP